MHIAFVSLGAFGHINPTLALVTELVKKGVRVTYFTTEAFRTIIEPTGAKFVAVPSWMAENDKHNEDGEKKEDDGDKFPTAKWQSDTFRKEAGKYFDLPHLIAYYLYVQFNLGVDQLMEQWSMIILR